jgi:hypothetical protein
MLLLKVCSTVLMNFISPINWFASNVSGTRFRSELGHLLGQN